MSTMADDDYDQFSAASQISSILLNSVQSIDSAKEAHDAPILTTVLGASRILHHLKSRAISFCSEDAMGASDDNVITKIDAHNCSKNENDHSLNESLTLLTCDAIAAKDALHELVHRVNLSRKQSKKSSGHAWKALEFVASPTLSADSEANELSTALALLAVGLALSMNSADASTTKMIAGAILPGEWKHRFNQSEKFQKSDGDHSERAANVHAMAHSMARATTLGLLRLASDKSVQSANGNHNIDLQIVAKIENAFSVGTFGRTLNAGKEDEVLSKAAAGLVASVLNGNNGDADFAHDIGHAPLISNDIIAPVLSIISNIRPWSFVRVEGLVKLACSMDLWHSAELLCDAAIDTVLSSLPTSTTQNGLKPRGEEMGSFLADSLISSLPRNSIAHLAAGVIIDVAFDNRLYRRADVFASEYYFFGGPERFAEARYLHACDTIDKLIKKRKVQIIDKQIERVDEMVARVREDSRRCGYQTRWHGEGGATETMSVRIREFSFRRLRASNMHAAATRLAKLWDMHYDHDPFQMMEELEKRRLTYLQWDDEECPGCSTSADESGPLPLPELISNPDDLLIQFPLLGGGGGGTVGFDCEFHESIPFVALLQLSTTKNTLLIDIPALTLTKDGCDALRITVGKMFTRSSDAQRVIGFACKEDIKRLRASPCVGADHWFPQDEYPYVEDLRSIIAEVTPRLGGGLGLQHFGLSRACEAFLGKQLDKAEQCSDWATRPLSPEQREYAALDAWACAAIHSKITTKTEQIRMKEGSE
ncbi:hypothetical protein ACHAW5_009418 [Stephanodiscus triporus]|uniref:3'-5' exonuclease domain-containing protein n=1 Tax=Stephanodiscus triporus TaxID=2934178 RepID=A0ABD3QNW9_9STRA